MKKPYIKKIAQISKFSVWVVDGKFIRDHWNINFTNFGQHFTYDFIPENEFWVDDENSPDETRFYIDHMLVENRLMAQGLTYLVSSDIAEMMEQRERGKSKLMKEEAKKKDNETRMMKQVHKKLLRKYSKYLKVWIVDGKAVRDFFLIYFTTGGHDKVYKFIPKGEVWIDDGILEQEIKLVLLHELEERALMAKGMPYNPAHIHANHVEYQCRHHPEKLDKKLKEAIEKNKV